MKNALNFFKSSDPHDIPVVILKDCESEHIHHLKLYSCSQYGLRYSRSIANIRTIVPGITARRFKMLASTYFFFSSLSLWNSWLDFNFLDFKFLFY